MTVYELILFLSAILSISRQVATVDVDLDVVSSLNTSNITTTKSVYVFHFILKHWYGVEPPEGVVEDCMPEIHCEWTYAEHIKQLKAKLSDKAPLIRNDDITVSVYNIHSLWQKSREHQPSICELRTNLTLAESEESKVRYSHLFDPSFKNFDGYSTSHPMSHIQRVYAEVFLNSSNFLPLKNFSSLIKGGAYIASDCHRHDNANANRDGVVHSIRQEGFRVDGLGKCMRSADNPEGISLPNTRNTRYNLELKRRVISSYMFYLAFENSIEPGYVTEKPFDALIGGSVPIYLGDHQHFKKLQPHPKASISVADFDGNYTALVEYLQYLMGNETAYEEHRDWRKTYSYERNIQRLEILQKSWYCRVCQWAAKVAPQHHKRIKKCIADKEESLVVAFNRTEFEGRAVKGKARQIFIVQNETLRGIPDFETFTAMKLDWKNVVQLADEDLIKYPMGEQLPGAT